MPLEITPIKLAMPLGLGSVNCYLLRSDKGFVLVDTGAPGARARLLRALQTAGCHPGGLKLIVITHGDFDHTGNAAHLRRVYGSRIAMHADDAPMAELGDMFVNRNKPNALLRALIPKVIGFGRSERFTPDLPLEDGTTLADHGLEARVLSLPGHSRGSIGVLTGDGDFFCGDLLESTGEPAPGSIMDDRLAADASLARLRGLRIARVYPGHGVPFLMERLRAG